MIPDYPVDRDAIIRTVWGESRGEGQLGQEAVAHVILNRVSNPGWWGRTPYTVCHAPKQFSCWNLDDPNAAKIRALCASDDDYQRVATVVNGVLSGLVPDPTKGADHYKVNGTKASWDVSTVNQPGVVIGHHVFFKLGLHA